MNEKALLKTELEMLIAKFIKLRQELRALYSQAQLSQQQTIQLEQQSIQVREGGVICA